MIGVRRNSGTDWQLSSQIRSWALWWHGRTHLVMKGAEILLKSAE
jgi:hypothetical protein